MRALIFTGGEIFEPIPIPAAELVIAADSGYLNARRCGVNPDLLIGDFDSLDPAMLSEGEPDEIKKIAVSPIKDDTDTQLAVDTAIDHGADEIILFGGLGGRLDHTLSNVFLLEYIAEKGIGAHMTDGRNHVDILRGGERMTVARGGGYLSLISLTDLCEGVCVKGVYYPLTDAALTRRYSFAVSNEIIAEEAEVSLDKGVMLVIQSRD